MKEKVKNMTAAEAAAKKASNDKKLATMRANLAKIEKEADDILKKIAAGEATPADRIRLLSLVNVAFHEGGKIDGINSVDSCASCEFCQKMMQAAVDNVLMICGACYAAKDAYKEAAWRRHSLNARIFSTVLFTVEELKTLKPFAAAGMGFDDILCRFNEDGDTVNETHARNYLRIGRANPGAFFGYWYKNSGAVEKGLKAEGYTTREQLPKNIRFIHSSPMIGFAVKALWFDDAVFTVFPDAETTEKAIAAGAHECNGKRCRACGFFCYKMQRQAEAVQIAEVLRCSAKVREVILAAYHAKKAEGVAA